MNKLVLLIVVGLLGYGGYQYWIQRDSAQPKGKTVKIEEPAPEAKVGPTPTPTPTPAPAPPKAEEKKTAPPQQPAKRLAPEGVFYVIRPFSISTDSGVRGVRQGTGVKLVKDSGAMLRVTDGQQEFDAKREDLTNDLDIAEKALAQQRSQQAAIAEWHQQRQAMAAVNNERNAVAAVATAQSVYEQNEAARAAAAARTQRIADIRAQITAEEIARRGTPLGYSRQKWVDVQNEKIRALQAELTRLGMGSLDR